MVRGLDLFQHYFADYMDHYVLIGGSACSLAFDAANVEFRATKDLDLVLTLEVLNDDFAKRLWQFVRDGQYSTYQRSKDIPSTSKAIRSACSAISTTWRKLPPQPLWWLLREAGIPM